VGMTRKCNWCGSTTNKPLDDFYLIGWSAVEISNGPVICACEEHGDKLKEYMEKELLEKAR
jgi:hypothetical protein